MELCVLKAGCTMARRDAQRNFCSHACACAIPSWLCTKPHAIRLTVCMKPL